MFTKQLYRFVLPLALAIFVGVPSQSFAQDMSNLHGYVVDRNNKAVVLAVVLPYRHIGQAGGTVGADHPAGAGYFAPPGDEMPGWYSFHIHLPNGRGTRLVGPIYIGPDTEAVVLPTEGRPPYYGYVKAAPTDPLPEAPPYFFNQVLGVNYCGFFSTVSTGETTGEFTNGVQGYVVDGAGNPVVGAKVYPYRYIDQDAWAVGPDHPMGGGYFSAGMRETGWHFFDVQLPNNGSLVRTQPFHFGAGHEFDTLVVPVDGRDVYYGNPYTPATR